MDIQRWEITFVMESKHSSDWELLLKTHLILRLRNRQTHYLYSLNHLRIYKDLVTYLLINKRKTKERNSSTTLTLASIVSRNSHSSNKNKRFSLPKRRMLNKRTIILLAWYKMSVYQLWIRTLFKIHLVVTNTSLYHPWAPLVISKLLMIYKVIIRITIVFLC